MEVRADVQCKSFEFGLSGARWASPHREELLVGGEVVQCSGLKDRTTSSATPGT